MSVCGPNNDDIVADLARYKLAYEETTKVLLERDFQLLAANQMVKAATLVAHDLNYQSKTPTNVDEAIKKRFDSLQSEAPTK